jgi:hypothetical protein
MVDSQGQVNQLDQSMEALHTHVHTCGDYSGASASRSDDRSMSHHDHSVFPVPSHQSYQTLGEPMESNASPMHESMSWHCGRMQYPSPPPPSPARFHAGSFDRGRNTGTSLMTDEAWIAMRLRTSGGDVEEMGEQEMHTEESSSHQAPDSDGQASEAFEYDDSMDDELVSSRSRQHSHAARTISKWEELLQAQPNDPMAFYWREMIHWCRARNRNGGTESESGVKRGAQYREEAMLEESVDLLNRLVKRCRCNDDTGADGAT